MQFVFKQYTSLFVNSFDQYNHSISIYSHDFSKNKESVYLKNIRQLITPTWFRSTRDIIVRSNNFVF